MFTGVTCLCGVSASHLGLQTACMEQCSRPRERYLCRVVLVSYYDIRHFEPLSRAAKPAFTAFASKSVFFWIHSHVTVHYEEERSDAVRLALI